jgi:predicted component of type VI protein secretion system
MPISYYTLPFDVGLITKKVELPRCSLKQSIAHHLHLLLTTSFGELLCDQKFGNSIWDADFDNVDYRSRQKEVILQSLLAAIKQYEPRIENIRIDTTLYQEEVLAYTSNTRAKKRLDVVINATIKSTNEPIVYRDNFFISPLSYN